jgi:hypothetical protein
MMLKEGDKYIHFTKYGSVNKGEVQSCGYTTSIDTFNLATYKKQHIISTKGIMLELDGSDGKIYKIEDEFTPEQAENINNFIKSAIRKKTDEQIR